ncbi:HD domain-containing protein [Heliobacterium gestii]|uniref:HD domain-containing protein n=1 Tax=Heliomicrobium gestii TaxID=2699 RepID=A0A845LK38_HELGE|nr:HD domain-containing protein [Heliomicrobium gestii]MZP43763.1 HD domain-containing protein [Heliomicrobium gestii]
MKTEFFSKIIYRCRQVQRAWRPRFSPAELAWVDAFLTPEERTVFLEMAPADRRHALDVARLCRQAVGEQFTEPLTAEEEQLLLKAALLHDMGKRNGDIGLFHRILYVLLAARLGKYKGFHSWPLVGKPLAVLADHASLGAQEATRRRWTPALVALIRCHHSGGCDSCDKSRLFSLLQQADNRC